MGRIRKSVNRFFKTLEAARMDSLNHGRTGPRRTKAGAEHPYYTSHMKNDPTETKHEAAARERYRQREMPAKQYKGNDNYLKRDWSGTNR